MPISSDPYSKEKTSESSPPRAARQTEMPESRRAQSLAFCALLLQSATRKRFQREMASWSWALSQHKPLRACKLTVPALYLHPKPAIAQVGKPSVPPPFPSEKLGKNPLKLLLMKYRNLTVNISFQSSMGNLCCEWAFRGFRVTPLPPSGRKVFHSEEKGKCFESGATAHTSPGHSCL